MKNLLAKFYKVLACRVALAVVATASVAHAHDLPQHFPLAPTDWGMIQQDCIGHQSSGAAAINMQAESSLQVAQMIIAEPDVGNPPEPTIAVAPTVAYDLIGPALYDGVDCAKLESYYRNVQTDQLVEYKNPQPVEPVAAQPSLSDAGIEFHKSFFAACSCDFENRQANQSIMPPKFVLKRTYVDDQFAIELNRLKPLVLRDFGPSKFAEESEQPLAVAVPTVRVTNKHILADALSQLASFDCIARSEFYNGSRAFQLGEFTGSAAKTWFANALPSASKIATDYVQNLKPAKIQPKSAPMFVILQTAAGNDIAIPVAEAQQWDAVGAVANDVKRAEVSEELKALVDSANARLQWAGGRLSAAANFMNDWFSDRIARAKSNDLR